MSMQDIRYLAAGALLFFGFLLMVGTLGKLEFDGFIEPAEFLAKTAIGIAMMAASVPVSGDMDEIVEEISEQRKSRR